MPTSPLERNPVTPPSVGTGQGGARRHGNDAALGRRGGWCFDHSRTTLGLWAALLVVVFIAAGVVGNAFGSGSTIPVSDSAAGFAVLEEGAPLPADLTINNEQEWTFRS